MFFSHEITDSMELGMSVTTPAKTMTVHNGDDDDDASDKVSADDKREQFELPRDTYTIFFVSNCWKVSTMTVYVFMLKVALYSMLFLDDLERGGHQKGYGTKLLVAQGLLLPIAVAMQQDLTNSLALIANAKYSKALTKRVPGATYQSYCVSIILRLADGMLGLTINVIVMFHATSVLSMFLNFAALHFLQSIDDIMGELSRQGFFGDHIQETAKLSEGFTLPARREGHRLRTIDSIGYALVLLVLVTAWIWYIIDPPM